MTTTTRLTDAMERRHALAYALANELCEQYEGQPVETLPAHIRDFLAADAEVAKLVEEACVEMGLRAEVSRVG